MRTEPASGGTRIRPLSAPERQSAKAKGRRALGRGVRTLAVVVPRKEGEEVRRALKSLGALRQDLAIREEGDLLLLPVAEAVDVGYPLRETDLEPREGRPRTYREVVEVPDPLRPLLPRSFDVVGDVLLLKLPEELEPHREAVGEALLTTHPGVRTVALDRGVRGPFRERRTEVVAGAADTRTVHREYGLEIAVDPAAVHFSPRVAAERRRVAQQVAPGEVVADAFCGVGPFALHVARAGAGTVYAVDANPVALAFLRENVRRNRADAVVPIEGDADNVLPTLEGVDRVILDFPQEPLPHLAPALEPVREGGVLHYYEILERTVLEARLEEIQTASPGRALEVLDVREVRGYSPTQAHYGVDLRVGPG